MQATTIKLQQKTKSLLDSVKQKQESYDTAILKLVREVKHKDIEMKLKEGYERRAKYMKEFEEWENASNEVPDARY